MLTLKKVAITGGVASGKTSASQVFKDLGAYVVNADAIVHESLMPTTDLGKQVILQFGPDVVVNGQIDRRSIAKKAFKDPELLKKLEKLVHPVLLKKIHELYEDAKREGTYCAFVVEIPLLFEIGADAFYDVVITILADEKLAKERFERAGFHKTEYDLRMKRQLPPEKKAAKSHYTIHNNGSLEDLRSKVIELNRIIQKH